MTGEVQRRPLPMHKTDRFYEASSWSQGIQKFVAAQRGPLEGAAVRGRLPLRKHWELGALTARTGANWTGLDRRKPQESRTQRTSA